VRYRQGLGGDRREKGLGRPKQRWGDNIKMRLQEVGCGVIDCIDVSQERDRWRALVNVVMNVLVP
jgi:hypothetical protein